MQEECGKGFLVLSQSFLISSLLIFLQNLFFTYLYQKQNYWFDRSAEGQKYEIVSMYLMDEINHL